ncbi:MAG: Iron transporter permease, partial [Deltaproteobacteria bacterium]|nr:Iron transporter permease [Deltaproteobacteria bacterium]
MSTQVLIPDRQSPAINWSKLSLVTVACGSALAILVLLGMIVWMSLRTGVPGQQSDITLKNYSA